MSLSSLLVRKIFPRQSLLLKPFFLQTSPRPLLLKTPPSSSSSSSSSRWFQTQSSPLYHGDESLKDLPDSVSVTFIDKDGDRKTVQGKVGERLMYLAHRKDIDMEGACEASLACVTCHCYVETEDDHWEILPEATEEEEDLLDMAPFLKENSRLGCQIILSPELDGLVVRLPKATRNFYVDGFKPQPH